MFYYQWYDKVSDALMESDAIIAQEKLRQAWRSVWSRLGSLSPSDSEEGEALIEAKKDLIDLENRLRGSKSLSSSG